MTISEGLAQDIKIAELECRIFQLEAERQFAPMRQKLEGLVETARAIVDAPKNWVYSTATQTFVPPPSAPTPVAASTQDDEA